ncbi:uncharacterized protein PITG_19420 [Phytophthora infestans T30-4]|uniref:Uncharacterized protein n=1 Tax=Phytophthora infestans (strain T30-4) TaxID=403677 RepID=D0P097_PHYIT|nr:uncharacterized protein PITG_19420 [Phytophthora infestans T30-4]EEY70275.1 hypothetical protein PITG_19420 [Phytophthora infestans T30-4]|eukprot:XP_002996961.1 hypothetical protein PITG_19420 [Phytophthora infestans T30-4]
MPAGRKSVEISIKRQDIDWIVTEGGGSRLSRSFISASAGGAIQQRASVSGGASERKSWLPAAVTDVFIELDGVQFSARLKTRL